MITTPPVAPGTAENLARIWHFRALAVHADGTDQPDAGELDAVAHFLIGPVGGPLTSAEVWRQIADDCDDLWFLITDDWDERNLDDLTEAEWARSSFPTAADEVDARYVKTRERLAHKIEHAVWLARYEAAEKRRADARRAHKADVEARIHPTTWQCGRCGGTSEEHAPADSTCVYEPALTSGVEAAMQRHPAGSRLPAHLTGSDRRGGGNPLGDYLHLKGEGR